VRDLFTSDTEAVTSTIPVHHQILEFTRRLMPEAEDRVKLHDAASRSSSYGIEPDFERLSRRIELPRAARSCPTRRKRSSRST
jgi:hypothetical protein